MTFYAAVHHTVLPPFCNRETSVVLQVCNGGRRKEAALPSCSHLQAGAVRTSYIWTSLQSVLLSGSLR